jgi:hypothetical protein
MAIQSEDDRPRRKPIDAEQGKRMYINRIEITAVAAWSASAFPCE